MMNSQRDVGSDNDKMHVLQAPTTKIPDRRKLCVAVLIPIYNHAHQFRVFSEELMDCDLPVLVVDDGSDEKNQEEIIAICRQKNFQLLRLDDNQGKGKAMIEGFLHLIKNGFTHAIQIDADGQHNAKDIEKFLRLSEMHPAAIINGCPQYDHTVPASRLHGRKITNFCVKLETLFADIEDSMCGFRLYPLAEIRKLLDEIKFHRMGIDIEIIVKAARKNIKIINQKTNVKYPAGNISSFRFIKDNVLITALHTYLFCTIPAYYIRKKWST